MSQIRQVPPPPYASTTQDYRLQGNQGIANYSQETQKEDRSNANRYGIYPQLDGIDLTSQPASLPAAQAAEPLGRDAGAAPALLTPQIGTAPLEADNFEDLETVSQMKLKVYKKSWTGHSYIVTSDTNHHDKNKPGFVLNHKNKSSPWTASFAVTGHQPGNRNSKPTERVVYVISNVKAGEFTFTDPKTNIVLRMSKVGHWSKKWEFIYNGTKFAWKVDKDSNGNLRLLSYPQKVVVAYYTHTRLKPMKDGEMDIMPGSRHLMALILATGMVVEEVEREAGRAIKLI